MWTILTYFLHYLRKFPHNSNLLHHLTINFSAYPYTTGELGNPIATHTYSYDDANWKDKLTSYDGQTITYDEIGNPLQYRDNMVFTWENGRELATINNIRYQYNGDGIRIHKTVDGVDTDYYYNGDMLLTQISGDNRIDFYYDQAGGFLGFNYNGTDYYYMFNAQSDIIGIIDSNGNIVVNYTYDSWGNPISITGTLTDTVGKLNPIRYRCYYYDNESGLYYVESRYYDRQIKRFITYDDISVLTSNSSDPHWDKNLFAYCENNPIMFIDEDGEFPQVVFGAIIGAVAGAATTIVTNALRGEPIGDGFFESVLTGAISGGLASTGIGIGIAAAINGAVSFGVSAGSQYINDGSVDVGYAIYDGAAGAISTLIPSKPIFADEVKNAAKSGANQVIKTAKKSGIKSAANQAVKSTKSVASKVAKNTTTVQRGLSDAALRRIIEMLEAERREKPPARYKVLGLYC